MFTVACEVARLPDVKRIIDLLFLIDQLCIFLFLLILSNPAFVSVSDINTNPIFNFNPTQYVI